MQLISEVEPRVILVANALASRIFYRILGHKFKMKFDEDLGCHTIQLNDKTVPTFLASMLTSGAMDRYSSQRLQWHIKKVSV